MKSVKKRITILFDEKNNTDFSIEIWSFQAKTIFSQIIVSVTHENIDRFQKKPIRFINLKIEMYTRQ